MIKKILILTSGHSPFDERILNKFGYSLVNNGYKIKIISSKNKYNGVYNSVYIESFDDENLNKKEKINKFYNYISDFNPCMIICCEPLPILSAEKYKLKCNRNCKIIYDVTEWYPENLVLKLKSIKKISEYLLLFLLNYFVSNLVDGFIICEKLKKPRYDFFAPLKQKQIIGNFPVLSSFNYSEEKNLAENLTFCFTGILSKERGFFRFLNIIELFHLKYPDIKLNIKLIGKFLIEDDEKFYLNKVSELQKIKFTFINWISYDELSNQLKDVNICFDLRDKNFFYNNSLPIKLFEYLACGKPIIYSDLFAIRNDFEKIDFGFLVNPYDTNEVIETIEKYINNPHLYLEHSKNARHYIEKKFNWELEEKKLLKFINKILID